MRVLNLLGCSIAGIALVAACSSPPPPSRAEQLSLLREVGIVGVLIEEQEVREDGGVLAFPVGICGVEFYYTGTDGDIPTLSVYANDGQVEQLSGSDNIGKVGKTAKTMFCLLQASPVPTSQGNR